MGMIWSNYIYIMFFQFVVQIIYYIIVITLSDSKFNLKKMLVFSLVISSVGMLIMVLYSEFSPFLSSYSNQLLSNYLCIFMNAAGIYFFMDKNWRKAFIFSGIISFIQDNLLVFNTILLPILSLSGLIQSPIASLALYVMLGGAMIFVLKKTNFKLLIKHILVNDKNVLTALVVWFSLPILFNWAMRVTGLHEKPDNIMMAYLLIFLMFVLLLTIFQYIAKAEIDKGKLKAQKAILMQQQMYVQSLENIQQELRTFQHDYKNMLSGLYIQAKEGEVEAIQEFLKKMTFNFDSKVSDNIRQTTQLSNIHIIELKGLLLTKLMEMQQKGIACNLEVLYPVETLPMELEDINRCLGILIDNAIEEVEFQMNPSIDIIISNQMKCVTILVKNKAENHMKFHEIWKLGYSTKGENRGLGLYSYQRILEKYTNVIPLTNWSGHYFTQELKIVGE